MEASGIPESKWRRSSGIIFVYTFQVIAGRNWALGLIESYRELTIFVDVGSLVLTQLLEEVDIERVEWALRCEKQGTILRSRRLVLAVVGWLMKLVKRARE